MDIALKSTVPEVIEVTKEKGLNYVFNGMKPFLGHGVMYCNLAPYPIFIRMRDGKIHHIPARPSNVEPFTEHTVWIEDQTVAVNRQGKEEQIRTLWKVRPGSIANGRVVYLSQWDVYLSSDLRALARANRENTECSTNDVVGGIDTIQLKLSALGQCPVGILYNDPYDEIGPLWTIIDGQIYEIKPEHDDSYADMFIVKFSSHKDHINNQISDYRLEELKDAFSRQDTFAINVEGYGLTIYRTLMDAKEAQADRKSEEVRRMAGISAKERERIKSEYVNEISAQKEQILKLTAENERLRRQLEIASGLATVSDQTNKRAHEQEVQHLQLKKEEARVAKSSNDVASSEIGMWSTAAKTAAVVVPLAVGGLGLYALKAGATAAACAAGTSAGFSGLASLSPTISTIRETLSRFTSGRVGLLKSAARGAVAVGSEVVSAIKSAMSGTASAIGKVATGIGRAALSAVESAGSAIGSAVSSVGSFVSSIFD